MNQPVQTITLKLSAEDVNKVLNALGRFPYVEVVGLLNDISKQAHDQLQPPEGSGDKE